MISTILPALLLIGAVVFIHELGHYLGLFHTTEGPSLSIHDPLPDTPRGGANNLMSEFMSSVVLTPGQGEVMLRHPAVRHNCL